MSQRKDESTRQKSEKGEQSKRSRARARNPSHVRKARTLGAQAYAEGRELIDDAQGLYGTVTTTLQEARAAIVEQAEQRPYMLVGGALLTGYVLGRRLPPSLARMAVAYGGRAALSLLMRQVLS